MALLELCIVGIAQAKGGASDEGDGYRPKKGKVGGNKGGGTQTSTIPLQRCLNREKKAYDAKLKNAQKNERKKLYLAWKMANSECESAAGISRFKR